VKPLRWRFSVYLLTVLMSLVLFMKSRAVPVKGQAAFLRYSAGAKLVKISGSPVTGGIYQFPDGVGSECVIKLTQMSGSILPVYDKTETGILRDGDSFDFSAVDGYPVQINHKRMTVAELHLLGVPVDIGTLPVEELMAVPGVGKVLAAEILAHSQKNGGIRSIDDLSSLPGVGEAKVRKIKAYLGGR
jgi:hypothetical protein